jgi:photosystem II stability/assembly factor-like uncharacterized protein
MPDLQEIEELPFPEAEVRSLIARVAAHGVSIATELSPEAIRSERSDHLDQEGSKGRPEDTRADRGLAGTSWLLRRSGLRKPSFVVAALVVVLAVITAGVLVESNQGSIKGAAGKSGSSWRLASMVGPSVQPFTPTSANAKSPSDITCPTVSVCYVTAQTVVTEPGVTNEDDPAQPVQLPMTSTAYVSTDSGSTWQQLTLPANVDLDTKFTCPSANLCMVGSQVMDTGTVNGNKDPQMFLITTDGGATWSEETIPMPPITGSDTALDPSLAGLYGSVNELTCFSASTCLAFGLVPTDQQEEPIGDGTTVERTVFLRTDDGGATWTTYAFPWVANPDGSPGWSNAEAGSFACGSSESCVGFSTVLSATPNQVFSDLSWRTNDGGATWSQAWLPGVQPGLSANSISCPDALHCVAIQKLANSSTYTSVAEVTSDGGVTWTEEPISNGAGAELLSVDCIDGGDCWLTGFSGSGNQLSDYGGVILESTDEGMTWSPVQLPDGIGSVDDVSCPASGSCFAIAGPSPASPTAAISQEVLTNTPGSPAQ